MPPAADRGTRSRGLDGHRMIAGSSAFSAAEPAGPHGREHVSKILVFGGAGQVAREIASRWTHHELVMVTRPECDITDSEAVRATVESHRPEVVVNAAAYVRVDEAEDAGSAEAFAVNAVGALYVARAAAAVDASCAYISSDFVFDGSSTVPYHETDVPAPVNVYGCSKLAGEQVSALVCPRTFIVRTSGLYGLAGARGKGGNFPETMIRLAASGQKIRVVQDQVVGPTSVADFVQCLDEVLRRGTPGTYHITNSGSCSWYEFARHILESVGSEAELVAVTSSEFGARARRPAYSVLDNGGLRRIGVEQPRAWTEAIRDYLVAQGHVPS